MSGRKCARVRVSPRYRAPARDVTAERRAKHIAQIMRSQALARESRAIVLASAEATDADRDQAESLYSACTSRRQPFDVSELERVAGYAAEDERQLRALRNQIIAKEDLKAQWRLLLTEVPQLKSSALNEKISSLQGIVKSALADQKLQHIATPEKVRNELWILRNADRLLEEGLGLLRVYDDLTNVNYLRTQLLEIEKSPAAASDIFNSVSSAYRAHVEAAIANQRERFEEADKEAGVRRAELAAQLDQLHKETIAEREQAVRLGARSVAGCDKAFQIALQAFDTRDIEKINSSIDVLKSAIGDLRHELSVAKPPQVSPDPIVECRTRLLSELRIVGTSLHAETYKRITDEIETAIPAELETVDGFERRLRDAMLEVLSAPGQSSSMAPNEDLRAVLDCVLASASDFKIKWSAAVETALKEGKIIRLLDGRAPDGSKVRLRLDIEADGTIDLNKDDDNEGASCDLFKMVMKRLRTEGIASNFQWTADGEPGESWQDETEAARGQVDAAKAAQLK